ncbi:MAG: acyltransferase [Desulfobacterales bacterium]|nr:acyltransferase [Desulfobacterales bacterium]
MLNFLPAPVRGVVALLLYTLNTIGCFVTMFPLILLKIIIFNDSVRFGLTKGLIALGMAWIHINSLILWLTQKIQWDIKGLSGFNPKASYLVISNHRSWADILILQHLFKRRIPFLKFFLKKELIWVPFLGIAWWALEFPFMKRYSREFIQNHPELKGTDIETTRKYCEKFKKSPISVINFLEGTRFDESKRQKQQSPFRHLLLPKAGGTAVVLSAMGESLDQIIDVTLIYPENKTAPSFWEFLEGRIPKATVRIRRLDIPAEFAGANCERDKKIQEDIRHWVNALWTEKDKEIAAILEQHGRSQ